MDANRRFSEKEVAVVLRKATEMEEQPGPSGAGLSLQELEQIAGEVGISPAVICTVVKAPGARDTGFCEKTAVSAKSFACKKVTCCSMGGLLIIDINGYANC